MFQSLKTLIFGRSMPIYRNLPGSPKNADDAMFQWAALVKEITEKRGLHKLPYLYIFLVDNTLNLKKEVAEALELLFHVVPPRRLLQIDRQCRGVALSEVDIRWGDFQAGDFISDHMSEGEKLAVLGFVSFHSNGHLRQKAIEALAEIGSENALPFLLVRLNDWVPQVRHVAKRSVYQHIERNGAQDLTLSLPLVRQLENRRRIDLKESVGNLYATVSDDRHALLAGLTSWDNETRRICFSLGLETRRLGAGELLDFAAKEKNGHVRAYFLSKLRKQLSYDEIRTKIPGFFFDRNTAVRIMAIDLYCEHFLDNTMREELEEWTIADSRSVRETARYYLGKLGMVDFANFYRENLNQGTLGVIAGLAETGNKSDAVLLRKFLSSKKPTIARTALKGISQMLGKESSDLLLGFLKDERRGVAKEASRHFLKHRPEHPDDVYAVYTSVVQTYVKKYAMKVLCALPPWDSMPYILEAVASDTPEIKAVGTRALSNWKRAIPSVYSKPTEDGKARIERALQNFRGQLDEELVDEIRFYMK